MNKITLLIFALLFDTHNVWVAGNNGNNLLPLHFLQLGYKEETINLNNVLQLYGFGKKFNAVEQMEACLSFIDNNAVDVMQLNEFLELPVEDIKTILSRKTLSAKEIEKFSGVAKWIKATDSKDEGKSQVLALIDLNEICTQDLLEVVLPSGLYETHIVFNGWTKRIKDENEIGFVLKFYHIAKSNNDASLIQACLSYIDNNALHVMQLDQFLKLSVEDVKSIFSRETLNAKEIEKFSGVAKWIKANDVKRDLLALIHLNKINSQDLLEIVLPSGLYESDFVVDGWRKRIQAEVYENLISAQNETRSLRQELHETKATLQKTEERLATTEEKFVVTKDQLNDTKNKVEDLQRNPVPIGFIYVQIPSQPEPKTLWATVEWKDVTSDYAGLFFRAEGGQSAAFGVEQEENSPRLIKLERIQDDSGSNGGDISPGSSANVLLATVDSSNWRSLKFHVSGGEVRPRNKAIRIWKRTN